jgi:hypothetical protein
VTLFQGIFLAFAAVCGIIMIRGIRWRLAQRAVFSDQELAEIRRETEREKIRCLAELDTRIAELDGIQQIKDPQERLRRLAQFVNRQPP